MDKNIVLKDRVRKLQVRYRLIIVLGAIMMAGGVTIAISFIYNIQKLKYVSIVLILIDLVCLVFLILSIFNVINIGKSIYVYKEVEEGTFDFQTEFEKYTSLCKASFRNRNRNTIAGYFEWKKQVIESLDRNDIVSIERELIQKKRTQLFYYNSDCSLRIPLMIGVLTVIFPIMFEYMCKDGLVNVLSKRGITNPYEILLYIIGTYLILTAAAIILFCVKNLDKETSIMQFVDDYTEIIEEVKENNKKNKGEKNKKDNNKKLK